jgi:hypothetical protein
VTVGPGRAGESVNAGVMATHGWPARRLSPTLAAFTIDQRDFSAMDSELRDHAQTLIERIVHLKDSL